MRKAGEGYEIVAGERRWRASQRAGLLKVPVVVRDIPDDKLLAAALIENLQREDLNPIEEAHAYRRLADEFHLTQEQIADAVGKDRSSIANVTRLLELPLEIRENVAAGAIAMGHARALLSLPDEAAQLRWGRDVVSKQLSVREIEVLVKKALAPQQTREAPAKDVHTRAAEDRCASRSARTCVSSARAKAAGSKSISNRKTSSSGSTSGWWKEAMTEQRDEAADRLFVVRRLSEQARGKRARPGPGRFARAERPTGPDRLSDIRRCGCVPARQRAVARPDSRFLYSDRRRSVRLRPDRRRQCCQ